MSEKTGILRVRNWVDFQHYKRRNPPWIKLHRKLLDNREYQLLADGAARLLFDVWLIASESDDGALPFDSEALAWRLRKPVQEVRSNLQVLIRAGFLLSQGHDASTALALRLQDATPEAETERETESSSSAKRETVSVPPDEERLSRRLASDGDRSALLRVLAKAANRQDVVMELLMILDGGRPNVSPDPVHVGLALCDYATNEKRWINALFRSYVQRAARPAPVGGGRSAGRHGNPGAEALVNILGPRTGTHD